MCPGWLGGWGWGRGRRRGSAAEERREIPVAAVRRNPYQPRRDVAEESLEELCESIRKYGVLQPIIVRPVVGGYELIAGERRLRAATMAGLAKVPAVVRDLGDREMAVLVLVENLQREDLSFLEEAEGYRQLVTAFGLTQEEVARRVGKDQSTVANKLRLLRLGPEVRAFIAREKAITERHARALLRLPSEAWQVRVLREVVSEGLNVRETERRVEEAVRLARRGVAPEEGERVARGRVVRVFKDVRIFLNTIRSAVSTMREAGVDVRLTEVDGGDYIELRMVVPKKK